MQETPDSSVIFLMPAVTEASSHDHDLSATSDYPFLS